MDSAVNYRPELAPVADSLALSSLVALLPLVTIFVTLGVLRWKAHRAGIAGLVVAIAVAVAAYGMPAPLALLSASQGAMFGLFPIMWIVFAAIWLYQITVVSGRFEDLRASFNLLSDDPRVQAIVIAYCFGGLLEALAGFGAPAAITGVMLMALGFSALRAATVVLLANTAPVAFGAVGTPIITAGNLTGIPFAEIGAYVGRQTPLLAAVVPLMLVFLVDGRRGVRQTWPIAAFVGLVFGVAQFISSNYISVELSDIIASLAGLAAAAIMLRFWQPSGGDSALKALSEEHERELALSGARPSGSAPAGAPDPGPAGAIDTAAAGAALTPGRIGMALFPYLLVIVVFSLAKLVDPVSDFLTARTIKIPWPGLDGHVLTAGGEVSGSTVFKLDWLSSPGLLLVLCGCVVALVYRVRPRAAVGEAVTIAAKLRWAFVTVSSLLAMAYVMNLSGQTITIGEWIAHTGGAFAFLSPILGWLGTAVTGSDTSANALFSALQLTAANSVGLDPTLMVAANTSGGVVGKMISPQNLTIAATAVGLVGRESEILRKVVLWSLALLIVVCMLVGLQSTPVLSWMLP